MQFVLTVFIAVILYGSGEHAAALARRFGRRLAGERGEQSVLLAGQAIRSVALGVVVTAVGQSLLGGLGLALAGVPLAAVLTAVMFMLCIAQLGPLPVLVPAVIWLYWSGESVWGTVLVVWSILLSTLDSVVRPLLIRKGAHLPLVSAARRGDRRPDRLWPGRYFPRPGGARGGIHLAALVDGRGQGSRRGGSAASPQVTGSPMTPPACRRSGPVLRKARSHCNAVARRCPRSRPASTHGEADAFGFWRLLPSARAIVGARRGRLRRARRRRRMRRSPRHPVSSCISTNSAPTSPTRPRASLPMPPSMRASRAPKRLSSRRGRAPPARRKPTNISPRRALDRYRPARGGRHRADHDPPGADRPDRIERSDGLQSPGRHHPGALIAGSVGRRHGPV